MNDASAKSPGSLSALAPDSGKDPAWAEVRDHPAWKTYQDFTERLPQHRFPSTGELNALPGRRLTARGHAVTFVDANLLAGESSVPDYESEIAATGRVSTRADNRHDLCNALVWARFPATKAALNARHLDAMPASTPGRRGSVRDALTLFDECGGVVTCPDREPLETLADHDWGRLFGKDGSAWPRGLQVIVFGHAMLEMLWDPYKAMTGRCVLLQTTEAHSTPDHLDRTLARLWRTGGPINAPADLCPLPFLGVPGWWPGIQNTAFYDDVGVFRPPRAGRVSPAVLAPSD